MDNRLTVLFLVVMGISAAAAVPFMGLATRPGVDNEESTAGASDTSATAAESKSEESKPVTTTTRKTRRVPRYTWSAGETTSSKSSGSRTARSPSASGGSNSSRGKKVYLIVETYRDSNGKMSSRARYVTK